MNIDAIIYIEIFHGKRRMDDGQSCSADAFIACFSGTGQVGMQVTWPPMALSPCMNTCMKQHIDTDLI